MKKLLYIVYALFLIGIFCSCEDPNDLTYKQLLIDCQAMANESVDLAESAQSHANDYKKLVIEWIDVGQMLQRENDSLRLLLEVNEEHGEAVKNYEEKVEEFNLEGEY